MLQKSHASFRIHLTYRVFDNSSILAFPPGTPGGFAKEQCEAVLSTIARGLEGLHRRGFGHWNLTPDSVVIVDGTASTLKLANFAILTHSRGPLPAGASPQRAAGLPLTPEDDLWALGCILLELISGVPTARRHAVEGAHTSAALTAGEVVAAAEVPPAFPKQKLTRLRKMAPQKND